MVNFILCVFYHNKKIEEDEDEMKTFSDKQKLNTVLLVYKKHQRKLFKVKGWKQVTPEGDSTLHTKIKMHQER